MADTKMSEKLWLDCKSDQERADFILCGRAHETGVIATSIQSEVAMAFQRLATLQTTPPADAALADEAAGVVSGLKRANELLRSEGYHPEAFDFSKAAFFIERVAARLRARAVPEGFVMVPVEPTEEMLSVAVDNWSGYEEESGRFYTPLDSDIRILWNVMLAASQSATGGAE